VGIVEPGTLLTFVKILLMNFIISVQEANRVFIWLKKKVSARI
jgi:hypothetical protein